MEIESELIGLCSIQEIKKGYMEDDQGYTCIICGQRFEKGQVYPIETRFYEPERAICIHIEQAHESMRKFLLGTAATYMGISDLQLQLLNLFEQGLTDKEIANNLGVSNSTIRNHRYKLRERERQNKVFIALVELLKEEGKFTGAASEQIKKNNIYQLSTFTEKEKRQVMERYLSEEGKLKTYPTYEKNKCIILEYIIQQFHVGKQYTEKEVKQILGAMYKNYKFLRDELLLYGYMDRTNKGAIYWVRNHEIAKSAF